MFIPSLPSCLHSNEVVGLSQTQAGKGCVQGCSSAPGMLLNIGQIFRKISKFLNKSLEHRRKRHRPAIKKPSFSLQTSYEEVGLVEVTAA